MTRTRSGAWGDWLRPCQQDHAKAGIFGQAGRLFVSTRPQSMLPLAARASRPVFEHRPKGHTSPLCCFSPAVNSPPVSPDAKFDRLRVVLVSPRNPLNIGAAARAMSNFGFFHLRVVNPYELAF